MPVAVRWRLDIVLEPQRLLLGVLDLLGDSFYGARSGEHSQGHGITWSDDASHPKECTEGITRGRPRRGILGPGTPGETGSRRQTESRTDPRGPGRETGSTGGQIWQKKDSL